MEAERRASPERSSGLPAGGAGGDNPGDRSPLPGSSGSSALLQADVLDLDEDEDDLEVFSKVRAAAARPGKVPGRLQELAALRAPSPRARPAEGWLRVGRGRGPPTAAAAPQRAAPSAACGQGPSSQPRSPLHFDLEWGGAVTSWSLQSCDFFFLFFLLFFSDEDFWGQCLSPGGGGPKVPPPLTFF